MAGARRWAIWTSCCGPANETHAALRGARKPYHPLHADWSNSRMTERYVVFSHGKDSEPWGSKIAAMAEIAREEGFHVESVDYRGIDDPQARVTRLLAFCKDLRGSLVLVGSSMGGYVSVAGSSLLQARGMFLLAPALYMPGYEKFSPRPAHCPTTIVHGWRDEVIPVDNSIRFAKEQKATLHVLDSDHRLLDQIRAINHFFAYFLFQIDEFL
jgi:pimeloyl-ACP methyl ester carboxylesterase